MATELKKEQDLNVNLNRRLNMVQNHKDVAATLVQSISDLWKATEAKQRLKYQTFETRHQDLEWHHAQCLDELHISVKREDRAARDLQEAARHLTLVQWEKDHMERYYVTLARESVSQAHRQAWLQDAEEADKHLQDSQQRESHDQSDDELNVGSTHVHQNVQQDDPIWNVFWNSMDDLKKERVIRISLSLLTYMTF